MLKYKYDVTTVTASAYDKRISIELPLDATAEELMDAFATLLKGLTFPDGVWEDMILTQAELIKERQASARASAQADDSCLFGGRE